MPWPTPQDYNEAIQNPRGGFLDPDLQAGKPELTPLGLPRPITGNFASVYRIHSGGRDWAVRCFFREYADIADRYRAISRHLATARLPYTVGFEYQEQGIRVRGTWYPILKMEWIEGELLNTFVARNLGNPDKIRRLSSRWLQMLTALRQAGVAHGDLQHGNVLVTPAGLRLVDYDGMFVPALTGRISHEIGHPNYQHPRRTGHHFSASIDHFSATVVYLSLLGVGSQPSLWDEVGGGDECLIFRRADLAAPGQSDIFSRLRQVSDTRVHSLTDLLERAVQRDPCDVPPLDVGTRAPAARRRRPGDTTADPPSSSRPVPAWVLESLPPRQPETFASPPPYLRAGLTALSATGVAVLITLLFTPSLVLLTVCAGAFALDAGLMSFSFLGNTAVTSRRQLTRKERLAARRLRAIDRRLAGMERKRQRLERQHADVGLALQQRRMEIEAREAEECREVISIIGGLVTGYSTDLTELDRTEREALNTIVRSLQDRHVRRKLGRARLPFARIGGVSWPARCLLWVRGVRSARDVTERALALDTLSTAQTAAVLRWHIEIGTAARLSMPSTVPRHLAWPVQSLAARHRVRLERRRDRALARQTALTAAIRARYRARLDGLDEAARLESERYALALGELAERERLLQQEEPVWSRRLADAQDELQRFEEIRFDRFVRALFLDR